MIELVDSDMETFGHMVHWEEVDAVIGVRVHVGDSKMHIVRVGGYWI